MKKIGIITHYYKSKNYGGVLQSYALVKVLESLGYKSEQICFDKKSSVQKEHPIMKLRNLKLLFQPKILRSKISSKQQLPSRITAYIKFRENIPHSEEVYDTNNIHKCVDFYDTYICGSDQVWNLTWYHPEYFLEFAPENKCKLSYAASMPNTNISNTQKELVKKHLESFTDISVREKNTAEFLESLTGRKIEWVLDPTMLLTDKDWDEVCSDRVVDDKYIFCYFLGTDKNYRKQAKNFAKKTNLKIVTLPHMRSFYKVDVDFGDIDLYDVTPNQFISLIKHAEYVITDSFHAIAFSNIYKTKYFVFNRQDLGEMSSRIRSLVSLTGDDFRFCYGKKMNSEYMLENKDIELPDTPSLEIQNMKNSSINFLKRNLNYNEEKANEN